MPNAKRPPRIVPSPMVYEGGGDPKPGLCPLCGETLTLRPAIYWHLPTDPDGVRRAVHALCAHEYGRFERVLRPMP